MSSYANLNKHRMPMDILPHLRKIHRINSTVFTLIFLFISVTGILLGWKKHSGGLIQARTYEGTSADLKDWLPLDSLYRVACRVVHDSISPDMSLELERIDIRKDKGVVKFIFTDHYTGLQVDGATARLLHIEKRRSDLIENIHDGSIIDRWLGIKSGTFKLCYTALAGLSLMTFSITGFFLWYLPKRRKRRRKTAGTTQMTG